MLLYATEESHRISNIIDIDRFSSLTKLLNVTAYVMKFVKNLKLAMKGEKSFNDDTCELYT